MYNLKNIKELTRMNYLPEPIGKFDAFYYLIEYLASLSVGVTVQEIATQLSKSEKTVRRYLESIDSSMLQIELIKERGTDKKYRYRINKFAASFRPLFLSAQEVISLYFIRGFAHFKDMPIINDSMSKVFTKIKVSSDQMQKNTGNDFYKRISELFILPRELGGKVYTTTNYNDSLHKLIEAAIDYKICELKYGSDDKNKKFIIGPLHFFNYRDALYLLSKNIELSSKNKKDIYQTLALHRIREVKVLNIGFDYPTGLDTKDFFRLNAFNFQDDLFYIKLKFPPQMKEYIAEREWFPNQKVKLMKDGGVELTFESDLNMMVIGWIRGFGPEVEVLEPEILRKNIITELKYILKKYNTS